MIARARRRLRSTLSSFGSTPRATLITSNPWAPSEIEPQFRCGVTRPQSYLAPVRPRQNAWDRLQDIDIAVTVDPLQLDRGHQCQSRFDKSPFPSSDVDPAHASVPASGR